jgi:hypothetical protein
MTESPPLSPSHRRFLDAAVAIRADGPTDEDRAYMARQLVQATMPHSNPGDVAVWSRTNGNFCLSIQPGVERGKSIGVPYGSLPRLLLFWLTTEAVRTKSRRIRLGSTLSEFMEELGLGMRGGKRGDITRLKNQMKRLFKSRISFDHTEDSHTQWVSMEIAPKGELWWDYRTPHQHGLFNSWIELGENFFEAVTSAPVPLDMRALKSLKQSPLALDLYAWTTYTAYHVNRTGKERSVSWELLHSQFGSDYAETKEFARKARDAFRKIACVYPSCAIDMVRGGVKVTAGGKNAIAARPKQRALPSPLPAPSPVARIKINDDLAKTVGVALSDAVMAEAAAHVKAAGTGWDFYQIEKQFYEYAAAKGLPSRPEKAFLTFVKKKAVKAP